MRPRSRSRLVSHVKPAYVLANLASSAGVRRGTLEVTLLLPRALFLAGGRGDIVAFVDGFYRLCAQARLASYGCFFQSQTLADVFLTHP